MTTFSKRDIPNSFSPDFHVWSSEENCRVMYHLAKFSPVGRQISKQANSAILDKLEKSIYQYRKKIICRIFCGNVFYTPCIPLGAHNTLIVLNADTDRGVGKINSSVGVIVTLYNVFIQRPDKKILCFHLVQSHLAQT